MFPGEGAKCSSINICVKKNAQSVTFTVLLFPAGTGGGGGALSNLSKWTLWELETAFVGKGK